MKTVGKWMWTLPLVAAGLFLLGSCVKEASETVTIDETTASPEVTAVIAANETRTVVDADLNVLWEKGDQISVFVKSQKNRCYELVGEGGEASGTFKYKSGAFYASEAPYYYGVYPYDPETTLYSDGTLSVTVPAVQPYREDSFAPGVNVMTAASDDLSMNFKNVCGYVQLKLYGAGVTVKSLVLKGNNGEEIAGSGDVFIDPDVDPELTLYTYGSATEITVEADTPVTLGETEEDATVFWFVVAPTVFEEGFTVQVLGEDGEVVFEKATEKEVEIVRNEVYRLKAVEVFSEVPAFTADITWTWAEDAEVDHNLYYLYEGRKVYSREALPLELPAGVVEQFGSKLDGAIPTSVTVKYEDEVVEDLKVSNFALKDGKLTVDVEGFEWDKTYMVTAEFTGLTVIGTLTTKDRNREAVTLPNVFEYTFDINKLDEETGFGYVEIEPETKSYYYWKSADITDDVYAAFLDGGVIKADDFADVAAFRAAELYEHTLTALSPGSAWDFVKLNKKDLCFETQKHLTAKILKEKFNSGKQDTDDPYVFVGNDMDRIITTYIGETIIIPLRFNYRVPAYDFLHQSNYTFNDGKWYAMASPKYDINKAALKEYDVNLMNVPTLAFNIVDADGRFFNYEDEVSPDNKTYFNDKNIRVNFNYSGTDPADATLLEPQSATTTLEKYGDLWSTPKADEATAKNFEHTVFYYRSFRDAIPMCGTLEVLSGGTRFEIPTSFEKGNGNKYLAKNDYSNFELRGWKPFYVLNYNPTFTIELDEHKNYVVDLFEGVQIYDGRQVAASTAVTADVFKGVPGTYVIDDFNMGVKSYMRPLIGLNENTGCFDWIVGDAVSSGGNGFYEGVTSSEAYSITMSSSTEVSVPVDLYRLVSIEGNILTFDYNSQIQFSGTATVQVTYDIQSPWYKFEPFTVTVNIMGLDSYSTP